MGADHCLFPQVTCGGCEDGRGEGGEGVGRLVDGVNLTTEDGHMWLAPFTPGNPHTLTITLGTPSLLTAVRVWNYNRSLEDSYHGVCEIMCDGVEV